MAKANALAFNNVLNVGKEEILKRDYFSSRLKKMKRKSRNMAFKKVTHDCIAGDDQKTPVVIEFFKRHTDHMND